MLKEAGVNTKLYPAHSTRAAATSGASESGVSLAEIMKTAGWKRESTFQKFYQKPVEKSCGFQKGLLKKNRQRRK